MGIGCRIVSSSQLLVAAPGCAELGRRDVPVEVGHGAKGQDGVYTDNMVLSSPLDLPAPDVNGCLQKLAFYGETAEESQLKMRLTGLLKWKENKAF